ncbi:MAG: hypothetical protein IBJ19_05800 [Gemmatimonadaceae bacterium]|nr:hypothetical protein [Gemmatimonadaceae bacterium]
MGYPHPPHPRETPVLSKYFGDAEARTLSGWRARGGDEGGPFKQLTLPTN